MKYTIGNYYNGHPKTLSIYCYSNNVNLWKTLSEFHSWIYIKCMCIPFLWASCSPEAMALFEANELGSLGPVGE